MYLCENCVRPNKNRGRILGCNCFPPCYSQSPLLTERQTLRDHANFYGNRYARVFGGTTDDKCFVKSRYIRSPFQVISRMTFCRVKVWKRSRWRGGCHNVWLHIWRHWQPLQQVGLSYHRQPCLQVTDYSREKSFWSLTYHVQRRQCTWINDSDLLPTFCSNFCNLFFPVLSSNWFM